MYAKYCLPIPVFHFWPKLTNPSARSLCDSWATCYNRPCRNILTVSLRRFRRVRWRSCDDLSPSWITRSPPQQPSHQHRYRHRYRYRHRHRRCSTVRWWGRRRSPGLATPPRLVRINALQIPEIRHRRPLTVQERHHTTKMMNVYHQTRDWHRDIKRISDQCTGKHLWGRGLGSSIPYLQISSYTNITKLR